MLAVGLVALVAFLVWKVVFSKEEITLLPPPTPQATKFVIEQEPSQVSENSPSISMVALSIRQVHNLAASCASLICRQ